MMGFRNINDAAILVAAAIIFVIMTPQPPMVLSFHVTTSSKASSVITPTRSNMKMSAITTTIESKWSMMPEEPEPEVR